MAWIMRFEFIDVLAAAGTALIGIAAQAKSRR